jgi:hypothetical protein
MRLRLGVIATTLCLLAVCSAAVAMDPPAAAPPVVKPATCVKLKVTANLRLMLRAAHHKITSRSFQGPPWKSTYYGRCGRTYFAAASFLHPTTGYTDQPEVFKRRVGAIWKDQGDTGGDLCGSKKVPTALLRAWKYTCS